MGDRLDPRKAACDHGVGDDEERAARCGGAVATRRQNGHGDQQQAIDRNWNTQPSKTSPQDRDEACPQCRIPGGDPRALKRLSVQFRGMGLPEAEIVVSGRVKSVEGNRVVVETGAIQGDAKLIRNGEPELEL